MSLPVWPNGWVFIYELSGSGFESSYSQLTLNFKDWTFGFIVTRLFRPKSGCLNKRGYCRPIARALKMIYIHWGVGQLSTTYYFWVMEVTGFWIKKRYKYKYIFLKIQKFPQSPESIEKHSSQYNGCITMIKCI